MFFVLFGIDCIIDIECKELVEEWFVIILEWNDLDNWVFWMFGWRGVMLGDVFGIRMWMMLFKKGG